jgi:hypothetical protein
VLLKLTAIKDRCNNNDLSAMIFCNRSELIVRLVLILLRYGLQQELKLMVISVMTLLYLILKRMAIIALQLVAHFVTETEEE